jgi:hypothetical protein
MTNGKVVLSVAPGFISTVGERVAVKATAVSLGVEVPVGVQVGGRSKSGVTVAVGGM